MKRASIDLGTNTCLLLVQDGANVLHDESNVVRLGEGVAASGVLNLDAMERARACLEKYVGIAKRLGVEPQQIQAVGTAQARDAKNAGEFFGSLEKSLGLSFRILSGDEEAKATFLGAKLPGISASTMVVMDIGGGSTELVAMPDANAAIVGESLPIGAVKITEKYLHSNPVTDSEFWAAEEAINQSLLKMKPWRDSLEKKLTAKPQFVTVAGTAVTLAMLQLEMKEFRSSNLDGVKITRGDAHRLVEELKWRTIDERKQMPGMEVKRADVILAGALIFWRVMEELQFDEAIVSTRGLRYGVFEL